MLQLLPLVLLPLAGGDDAQDHKVHAAPRPLSAEAVTEDWPSFLGPRRDGRSRETRLDLEFGPEGPPLLWEVSTPEGYAAPSLVEGQLVHTFSVGRTVVVECLDGETGKRSWRKSRPFDYEPRYIRNSGPRAAPTIDGARIYVAGIDNVLLCYALEDGEVLWQRDLRRELELPDDFFGVVASPLVVGDLLVHNVGVPGGPSIVALDKATGELVWGAEEEWGPSCASPVVGTVAGEEQLLVLAGGDSRPPRGGLVVLDPESGKIRFRYPFRSRTYESVLAASPLVVDDKVLVTAGYSTGTAVLAPGEDGAWSEQWKNRRLGCEFTQPIVGDDGLVHLVDGISGRTGAVVCLDPASGELLSRRELTWDETVSRGERELELSASIGQGALLHVDGRFLLLGDRGELLAIESGREGVEVLSRARLFLASEAWARPVVHRGLLYVRQTNADLLTQTPPRLLCYDLRGE